MLNFTVLSLLLRFVVGAPAIYLYATPEPTGSQVEVNLGLIGEFPSVAHFRLYKIKDSRTFFEKMLKSGRTTDPRIGFYSKNAVSSAIATVRRAKRNIRYYARDVFSYTARSELKNALDIESMESKIAGKEKMPPPLPKSDYELLMEWDSEEPLVEYHDYVKIPMELEEGGYILEVVYQGFSASIPLLITDAHVLLKRGVNKLLIYASNLKSSKPIKDAEIAIFSDGNEIFRGRTDGNGMLWVDKSLYRKSISLLMVAKDGELALAKSSTPYWLSYQLSDTLTCFVFTEKPIYRPGQTVYFKGIMRKRVFGKAYLNLPHRKFVVEITKGYSWEPEFKWMDTVKTDEFGTFLDSLILPENAKLGYYTLTVEDMEGNYIESNEFEVRHYIKPEFTVKVESDAERFVAGDVGHFTVSASFLSGQPVGHAIVKVKVSRMEIMRPFWERRGRWGYWWSEKEVVETLRLKTDENGIVTFRYTFPEEPFAYSYSFDVCAIEPNTHKSECTSKSITVLPGEYIPEIEVDQWLTEAGALLPVKLKVHNLKGEPVSCRGNLLIIKSFYRNREWVYDTVRVIDFRVPESGDTLLRVLFSKPGSYFLVAEVWDKRDRKNHSYTWVWVWGRGTEERARQNWLRIIALKPDSVATGDTAVAVFSTPFDEGYALVTLEAEDPLWAKVIRVSDGIGRVNIKMADEMWGSLRFTVNATYDDEPLSQTDYLKVTPLKKLLNVKVRLDRETYRPGDTVTAYISILDYRGLPVRADFSFAVVDEAIFILKSRELKPFSAFYEYRPKLVDYTSSNYFEFTASNVDLSLFAQAGRGATEVAKAAEERNMVSQFKGAEAAPPEARVRKKFKDTAFWLGNGRTNRMGRAKIKFVLPDNITKWRITVVAFTKNTQIGQKVLHFVTNKTVVVRLVVPEVIRSNDTLEIASLVQNGLPARMEFRVKFEPSENLKLFDRKMLNLVIPSHSSAGASWRLTPLDIGKATLKVSASTFRAGDAIEIHVPIQKFGIEEVRSVSFVLHGENVSKSGTLEIPGSAEITDAKIFVSMGPTNAIIQAVRFLKGYPYGCVEQTMSRFVPDVVAAGVLSKFNIKDSTFDDLPSMIEYGLNRIYHYQHEDGGWGWWTNDETDPHMTAYVVWGLKLAQENDVYVNPNVIERGARRLLKFFTDDELDVNEQVDVGFALSMSLDEFENPGDVKKLVIRKFKAIELDELRPSQLAKLTIAYMKLGEDRAAERALRKLNSMARELEDGSLVWSEAKYGHFERQVEPTAWALMANLTAMSNSKKHKDLEKVARNASTGLLWLKTGPKWHYTEASAYAVLALTQYSEKLGGSIKPMKFKVLVNGSEVASGRISAGNLSKFTNPISFDTKILRLGKNSVRVELSGYASRSLPLTVSLSATYFRTGGKIKSKGDVVRIKRKYFKIRTVREWNGEWREELIPLKYGDAVWLNEPILVKLTVSSSRTLDYVLVKEPLIPGCDVDVEDLRWRVSGLEQHADHIAFAIHYLDSNEPVTITYQVRPYVAGRFRVPPAEVEPMYQPEIRAHSDEMKIVVVR